MGDDMNIFNIFKRKEAEDFGPCDDECGSDISKLYKCVKGKKVLKKHWYDTGHTDCMM